MKGEINMFADTITYTDYNGVERTETFHFNLNEAELTEMRLMTPGGMDKHIEKIVAAKNEPELFKLFKEFMLKAYGVKSDDGKRFRKSKELSEEFTQTEAYNKILLRLCSDADYASNFVNKTLPNSAKMTDSKSPLTLAGETTNANN